MKRNEANTEHGNMQVFTFPSGLSALFNSSLIVAYCQEQEEKTKGNKRCAFFPLFASFELKSSFIFFGGRRSSDRSFYYTKKHQSRSKKSSFVSSLFYFYIFFNARTPKLVMVKADSKLMDDYLALKPSR